MENFLEKALTIAITLFLAAIPGAISYGRMKQKVTDMKESYEKDIEAVNKRIDLLIEQENKRDERNSQQHEKLFDVSNRIDKNLSEMKGFMVAKNQIMSELKDIFADKK